MITRGSPMNWKPPVGLDSKSKSNVINPWGFAYPLLVGILTLYGMHDHATQIHHAALDHGTSTVTVTVIQVIQAKENAAVVASSRTHLFNGHFRNGLIGGTGSIDKAYVLGLCKGISPRKIWSYMVLTYLHFRILKISH